MSVRKRKFVPGGRVGAPPTPKRINYVVLRSLREMDTTPHSLPLLPFPKPFPYIVLRRILHLLPWYHRIPLERTSKQFYHILHPQNCDLPPVGRTNLVVKRGEGVAFAEKSSIDLFPREQSGETHITVILTLGHRMSTELMLDDLERVLCQFPVTQIELSGLKEQAEEVFSCIALHTRHIRNITVTKCLEDVQFGAHFWSNFGKRMTKLKELTINVELALKVGVVDPMLTQMVSVCQFERIQVPWGITDASLVALSKNASKLHDFECRSAGVLTTKGVVALTQALVEAPPLPNGQRRRVFLFQCWGVDVREFWESVAGLLCPITWKKRQMVFLPKWDDAVQDFANDNVVVIFSN